MGLHFDYLDGEDLGVLVTPQEHLEIEEQVGDQPTRARVNPQPSTSYHQGTDDKKEDVPPPFVAPPKTQWNQFCLEK